MMKEQLKEKTKESLASVLPITVIVFLLSATVVPMETGTLLLFLIGAMLLIVGMGIFQLGAELAMTPLGQSIGSQMIKGNVGDRAHLLFHGRDHHDCRTGSASAGKSGRFHPQ